MDPRMCVLGHFCSLIVNHRFHWALPLESRSLLWDKNFSKKFPSTFASNGGYCYVYFDLTLFHLETATLMTKNSWPPPTNDSVQITLSTYCLVGCFTIMNNLTNYLFLLNSRAWIHNNRSDYHSNHDPTSTNTHNHTQTNYLPTEMSG